jgi:hypothetical protein
MGAGKHAEDGWRWIVSGRVAPSTLNKVITRTARPRSTQWWLSTLGQPLTWFLNIECRDDDEILAYDSH